MTNSEKTGYKKRERKVYGSQESSTPAVSHPGIPVRDLDPPIPADTVRWALANCHLMRDRFSIVDLAFFLGAWGPGAPDEVLADAARLGAGL